MTEHTQFERMKTSAFLASSAMRNIESNLNSMYKGMKVRLTRGDYKGRVVIVDHISIGLHNEALFFVKVPNLKVPGEFLNDKVDSRRGYRSHEIEEVV